MGKVKKWFRSISIPAAFIICGLTCLIAALALTWATTRIAQKNLSGIVNKYEVRSPAINYVPFDYDEVGFTELPAEVVSVEAVISGSFATSESSLKSVHYSADEKIALVNVVLMEEDQKSFDFFAGLDKKAAVIWYSVCLCIAALIFYLWKIRKPLRVLNQAVEMISANDLDFHLEYESQDEFGRLCRAFELMRQELVQNNRKMWNYVEERKRLNSAFAHDLRTPLTVLRGHSDLLLESIEGSSDTDGQIRYSAKAISGQITRLGAFIDTMGTLQRLEDYEPYRRYIASSDIAKMLEETASLLFSGGIVEMGPEPEERELYIDLEALTQICENVLSNASRFARRRIGIELGVSGEYLTISVEDDGPGFSAADLTRAALAYYRGGKQEPGTSTHFGLGLYTSSLLAEKLGGCLSLENGKNGGARVLIKICAI